MTTSIEKIVSSGQTGADRAALNWAIEKSVKYGGWCPKGSKIEDGPIDASYALQETPRVDYRWQNTVMRMSLRLLPLSLFIVMLALLPFPASADSDPSHMQPDSEKPQPWPGGIIPYDISKLTPAQQTIALRAMQRWMDTGAKLKFVPRTTEVEYVNFTGQTNAGNNTSHVGFKQGSRTDINITAFWWRDLEWMPVHELGHVLGFFHEQERWDRDQFVTIHYENIKPGRASDYDWIPKTNWIVSSLPYDYRSIMHYRVCWASKCESECTDGVGSSPCAVIQPVDKKYDGVIGQWTDNGISAIDAEKVRLVYGTRASSVKPAVAK